jgi:hypothetical protein
MFSGSFIFAGVFDNFERVAVGLCAIAGAFVLGYLLSGLLVACYYRLYLKKRSSPLVMRACRLIGGVLAALIVAALYFGEGGFGGGGGQQSGPEGGREPGKFIDEKEDPKKKTSPEKKEGDVSPEERIRVTMLGQDAPGDRYYLIDDDKSPKSLTELKDAILSRIRQRNGKPITELTIFTYRNTADRGNQIVKDVDQWAQQQGLRVSYREIRDQDRPE